MKQSSKKSIEKQVTTKQNKEIVKESNEFVIESFKITTNKLYLMMDKNEALEYEFQKEDLSKCFEMISSQRIAKSDIGTVFKKVSI